MPSTNQFLIVTHVPHIQYEGKLYAYGPYVREMNIWLSHVENYVLVAPTSEAIAPSAIDLAYSKKPLRHRVIDSLDFTSAKKIPGSAMAAFKIIFTLMGEMAKTNPIHLRCPGNVGLLGTLVQIGFPFKKKTAKYAGNWDWRSKQPISYRLQQYILRSPYLTSNMTALVYGKWPDLTKNIKPFFTASYFEKEKVPVSKSSPKESIEMVFLGVLETYKSPDIALEVAKILKDSGVPFHLKFCGEGSQRRKPIFLFLFQNQKDGPKQ